MVAATPLDHAYRSQRIRIVNTVRAQTKRLWAVSSTQQQQQFVGQAVPVVAAGQAAVVTLVDGYLAAKAQAETGEGAVQGLDPAGYTTGMLRGAPAAEVYARPFGVLGAAIAGGAEFSAAKASGGDYLDKLVSTDLQLAQTHSARDWMSNEPRVTGWQRVTSGGCDFCQQAASRTYRTRDLMPIHEHCHCSVVPVFGDVEPEPIGDVEHDHELGARLPTP